jgi:hypothetical protein
VSASGGGECECQWGGSVSVSRGGECEGGGVRVGGECEGGGRV